MTDETIERALRSAADELRRRHQRFALVGGLAVSKLESLLSNKA
jgi:hypothetical protein